MIKTCLLCGKKFKPYKTTPYQKFCSDKCRYYYRDHAFGVFPKYRCQNCEKVFQLDFDVFKDFKKLEKVICPYCNKLAAA